MLWLLPLLFWLRGCVTVCYWDSYRWRIFSSGVSNWKSHSLPLAIEEESKRPLMSCSVQVTFASLFSVPTFYNDNIQAV